MELVTPSIGLVFWSAISFLLLIVLLGKFAWKPIMKAIGEREESITNALQAADKAKAEMTRLNQESEALMVKARNERDGMLKEAKELSTKMVEEAKDSAKAEAAKILVRANEEITSQKNAAIAELKNQVAGLSVGIAEKILRKQLSNDTEQQALVADMLKDVKMN